MKNFFLLIAIVLAFLSASAQIAQFEADSIVLERMSMEIRPHTIYSQNDIQTQMTINTLKGEVIELDYFCWVYFINYMEDADSNKNRYLIVKENTRNLLEININNDATPNNLAEWRVVTNEMPFPAIMDTLKGEWSWIKRYGGIGGNTTNNEFKSIVKILSRNEDASINYEIFVEDTLFYVGSFQIQSDRWNKRYVNIKLPHNIWWENGQLILWDSNWIISFGNRLTGIIDENMLCFDEDADDGYIYYYQKIDEEE